MKHELQIEHLRSAVKTPKQMNNRKSHIKIIHNQLIINKTSGEFTTSIFNLLEYIKTKRANSPRSTSHIRVGVIQHIDLY